MNLRRDYGGRRIAERVWIHGVLELVTPTHLGNGDAEALTDMPLLRDEVSAQPLLTGTSLAGALRTYLREYEHGYGKVEGRGDLARTLFGAVQGHESAQSWLIVDDALGDEAGVTLRDGVALEPETRTAAEGKKFDIELLQAGSRFEIELELLVPIGDLQRRRRMMTALAVALYGLQEGEIGLGMRKRRGLGECRVTGWQVCRYVLTTPGGLPAWLDEDRSGAISGPDIAVLLGVDLEELRSRDARERFTIEATLSLRGSLLIRSTGRAGATSGAGTSAPDMVHLHARRDGDEVPIVSGTSLAGALRARALRIANTLLDGRGQAIVDAMFGPRLKGDGHTEDVAPQGSRVLVRESAIGGIDNLVQQRVKIDRFTGGAYPQALFAEQPLFATEDSVLTLWLELRAPEDHEIGLLLLVLKDLWTGDLPLGGERSVGRGRLRGVRADLTLQRPAGVRRWSLMQPDPGLPELVFDGDDRPEDLESFVQELHAYRAPEHAPGRVK